MKKSTDDLIKILHQKPNADQFIEKNKDEMLQLTLTELLDIFLKEKDISRAEAINRTDIDRTYAYQIFDGRHKPSRDKLLCLAFGIGLTVDEVQLLLKTAQMQPLYPRVERDVIILESLFNNKTIFECNIKLNAKGFEILR